MNLAAIEAEMIIEYVKNLFSTLSDLPWTADISIMPADEVKGVMMLTDHERYVVKIQVSSDLLDKPDSLFPMLSCRLAMVIAGKPLWVLDRYKDSPERDKLLREACAEVSKSFARFVTSAMIPDETGEQS